MSKPLAHSPSSLAPRERELVTEVGDFFIEFETEHRQPVEKTQRIDEPQTGKCIIPETAVETPYAPDAECIEGTNDDAAARHHHPRHLPKSPSRIPLQFQCVVQDETINGMRWQRQRAYLAFEAGEFRVGGGTPCGRVETVSYHASGNRPGELCVLSGPHQRIPVETSDLVREMRLLLKHDTLPNGSVMPVKM